MSFRPKRILCGCTLTTMLLCSTALAADESSAGVAITLAEARAAARFDSALIAAAEADLNVARAELLTARAFPSNPEVEVDGARRSGAGATSRDRGYGISQEIEIGGQRSKRVSVAERAVAASEARLVRRRAEVDAAVGRAFGAAVEGRELVAIGLLDVELSENLRDFEAQRVDAGAATPTELNLARAAAARALSRLEEARAKEATGRAQLAEVMGKASVGGLAPRAAGGFPLHAVALPPLDPLVRDALARRADLEALRRAAEEADRGVTLARALRIPNMRIGAFDRREEALSIRGLSLGISLPLLNRGKGAVAQAESLAARARADLAIGELAARREIAASYVSVQSAAAAVAALEKGVVGGLEENLAMLQQSFEAGKLSSRDLLLFRRELVEARREQVEAQGRLSSAMADLVLATAGAISSIDQETPHVP